MKTRLSLVVAFSIALGGSGIAVAALNIGTHSPRLLGAGIIAAVIGIALGGIVLGRLVGMDDR